MSDHVRCEGCKRLGNRPLMKRAPAGWLYIEASIEGGKDILFIYACSTDCAFALWKDGPGGPWTPEELALSDQLLAPLPSPARDSLEQAWEEGYGSGWSDSRYARWGTHPNPHSSTEKVLAKQGKAKDRPLAAHLARASEPSLGPIRVRLEEMQKGPPIQDIQDDRLIWYVHVNEPDGSWHPAGNGPMFRRDAEALAQRFRDGERLVSIGTDPEKMGP